MKYRRVKLFKQNTTTYLQYRINCDLINFCEKQSNWLEVFEEKFEAKMHWYQEEYEDEDEDLMFSPAILARRASESWIVAPPVEVHVAQKFENHL